MKHIVNIFFLSFSLIFLTTSAIYSQSLSGSTFCLDPGSSQHSENQGPGGVSAYSVNLKVARFLESYLNSANADTVIITAPERYSSLPLPSREDVANLYGVDRFFSIHHDFSENSERNIDFVIPEQLQMPGELNNFKFDFGSIEANRVLNEDFLRLEALSYYKAILQYFDEPDVNYSSLSGVVYKTENNLPINSAQIHIVSLGLSYQTDNFDNGFFSFLEINSGHFIIEASAPGYKTQIDTISIDSSAFYFHDFYLIKNESPFVQNISPDSSQMLSPYHNIEIEFNRQMNAKSVEEALQIEPEFPYQIRWLDENKKMQIDPNSILKFNSEIFISIDTSAKDIFDRSFDSSPADLIQDPFLIRLKTESVDLSKPQILATWPIEFSRDIYIGDIINIEFNKRLDANSVTDENIYITGLNKQKIAANFSLSNLPGRRSLLQIIPILPLEPDGNYTVTLSAEIKDSTGNSLETDFQYQFFTERSSPTFYSLDDFSEGISNWQNPKQSSFSRNFRIARTDWRNSRHHKLRDTTFVGQLNFGFQLDGLLDVPFKGLSHLFKNLQPGDIVGTYIFGDSSLIKFRFYFSDSSDGFEAGPWKNINWFGWKPVYYKIGSDSTFEFVGGNGLFNGEIGLAGFQLYSATNRTGTIYFDDFFLQTSRVTTVNGEEESIKPKESILIESYPSPFSRNLGHTGITFSYEFPAEWGMSIVNLTIFNTLGQIVRELVNQPLAPGLHQSFWNVLDKNNQSLPAGIYFIRVQVGKEIQTRRLTILN